MLNTHHSNAYFIMQCVMGFYKEIARLPDES